MGNQWKWCVEDASGNILKGWYEDKGKWYYLMDNGTMATGWIKDKDGRWYYLDSNGAMQTGWLQDKGKWYYLNTVGNGYKGEMYSNGTYNIDGKEYKFDSSGAWIENTIVSDKCIEFIKSYEGYSSKAYYDGTGYTDAQLTIGYGTTKAAIPEAFPKGINSTCTVEQATQWLKEEVEKYAKKIKQDLDSKNVTLNQNQLDSLSSFAYNCGVSGLLSSTLYKRICEGVRDSSLKDNFIGWSTAGGKRLQGLYNRRVEEYNMFMYGDYKRDL